MQIGDEKLVHYDKNGNKIGETWVQSSIGGILWLLTLNCTPFVRHVI